MMSSFSASCNNKESLFNIMTSEGQDIPSKKRIYHVIKEASVTGKDMLFDSNGYSYLLNIVTSDGNDVMWICSMKNSTMLCDAAVHQEGSAFKRNQVAHIHSPRPNDYINIIIQQSLSTKIEQGFIRDFQKILNETFEEFKIPKYYVNSKWCSDLKRYFKFKLENVNTDTEKNLPPSFDASNSSDEDENNGSNYGEENLSILENVMILSSDTTFYGPDNTSYSTNAIIPHQQSESQESEVVKNIFNQLVETVQNFTAKPEDNVCLSQSIANDDYLSNFPHLKEGSSIDPNDFMISDVEKYGQNTTVPPEKINVIKEARVGLHEDESRFIPLLVENGKEDASSYLEVTNSNQDSHFHRSHFEEQMKATEHVAQQTEDNKSTDVKMSLDENESFKTSPFNCVTFPKGPEDPSLSISCFSDLVNEHPSSLLVQSEHSPSQQLLERKRAENIPNSENQTKQETLKMPSRRKSSGSQNDLLLSKQQISVTVLQNLKAYKEDDGCHSQCEADNSLGQWKGEANNSSENSSSGGDVGTTVSENIPDNEENSKEKAETLSDNEDLLSISRENMAEYCSQFSASLDTKNSNNEIDRKNILQDSSGKSAKSNEMLSGQKYVETDLEKLPENDLFSVSQRKPGVIKSTTNGNEMNENDTIKENQCFISVKKNLHSTVEELQDSEVKSNEKILSLNEMTQGDNDFDGQPSRKGFLGFPPQGKRKKEEEEEREEEEQKITTIKRSKSSSDRCSDLASNTLEDMFNDENSSHSIIIGEAFTINEEQMKELEDTSDSEAKTLKRSSGILSDNKDVEASNDSTFTSNKSKEYSPESQDKGIKKEESESQSKQPTSHQKPKKVKRSAFFKPVKKKKKLSKGGTVTSPVAPPPQRAHEVLPSFLQELASIDPALVICRERIDEEGNRSRVACIALHETILDWAFTDTMLSSFDSARTVRSRLNVPSKLNLLFPDEIGQQGISYHPVHVGPDFPFSMPQSMAITGIPAVEEARLSFPLEQFVLLCPSAVGRRNAIVSGGTLPLKTVTFADEPLEWAFKETFMSTFEDSPILSDLLGLSAATREWPDVAEEILAHEGVDHSFPFACPHTKKHLEGLLFHEFSIALPPTLLHETLQLPPLPSDLERRLSGERDALVRLLALASFYKHASCIPTVRSNRKLSVSHAALVSSFRPMVISQANSLAFVIREARANLLKGVTCQDPTIIPALIRGPVPSKRGFLFSNVHKLEAAVVKDPNNKLQYI